MTRFLDFVCGDMIFLHHEFTKGCQWWKALLAGTSARGHSELFQARVEKEIENDSDGKARNEKQQENVHLEKILKRGSEKEGPETWEQQESAKQKPETTNEDDIEIGPSSSCPHSLKRDVTDAEMNELDDEIEIKLVEKLMQEDMKWNKSVGSDMWPEHPETRIMKVDMNDFDENSWELLRAELVVAAEKGGRSKKDAGAHVREQAGGTDGCRRKGSQR